MKILVAGATGKTGIHLVKELKIRGHNPGALVRESSDTSALPGDVELRQGNLAHLNDNVCESCEVVIFAAGSGGSTGPELTDKIDRDGAKRLIDIVAGSSVSRFVMLSTAGADNPDPGSKLVHYLKAKHDADEHLKESGLSYTIVRLTEDDGSRNLLLGHDVATAATAAREDVAFVLANAVEDKTWTGKALLMQSA